MLHEFNYRDIDLEPYQREEAENLDRVKPLHLVKFEDKGSRRWHEIRQRNTIGPGFSCQQNTSR
jgi:hypothetical protein